MKDECNIYAAGIDLTKTFSKNDGKLLIYGLEEDTYEMTEVKTSTGYTLLRDKITIDSDTAYDAGQPQTYHQESLYTEGDSRKTVKTSTYQVGTLSFTAKVDGKSVDMTANGTGANASAHALVPMKVLNTKSPDLPKTGGAGTVVTSVAGLAVMAGLMIAERKGKGSKAK